MMTDFQPRVNEEELADSIRRAWRLMQYYRRVRDTGVPPYMERSALRYAWEYKAELRSLLAVRKAGRAR